ncbi:MAG: kynureninase [Rhodoferax sp.]
MLDDPTSQSPLTLAQCQQRDAQDPLSSLRDDFELPAGVIYLDGNSLGPLPRATAACVADGITRQWGQALIRAWNSEGWFDLPRRLGARIAPLIGAQPNDVVVADTSSVNLYKVLNAALGSARRAAPKRRVLLTETENFPTDLYIAQSLCDQLGMSLRCVPAPELVAALDQSVAVLMLTHVNYRTGAMHDLRALTGAAHAVGALTVWDLAHSVGAVPLSVHADEADFAIGCGYKYLNGGPGAPAFVWVHPRHQASAEQPLTGWWGHAQPFAFHAEYRPAPDIRRFQCGTPSILALLALGCGLDVFERAQAVGGLTALRAKSLALSQTFLDVLAQRCPDADWVCVTPRLASQRGNQLSFASARIDTHAVAQALIARGVIGDFRAGDGVVTPDLLRLGFAPLYLRFEDIWHAANALADILCTGQWRDPIYARRQTVT